MTNIRRLIIATIAILAVVFGSTSMAKASTWVPSLGIVPGASMGPQVVVGTAQYPAGVKMVTVRLDAVSVPGSIKHLMFSGILRCGEQKHMVGINITKGKGTLIVRKIMTDPTDCVAVAQSSLGRSEKDGLAVTATWKAEPISFYKSEYRGTEHPFLITPGQASDMVPIRIVLPKGVGRVKVRADFRSTACTVTGGSRENGSDHLCKGKHLNAKGTKFRFRVIARYGDSGKTCATKILDSRTVTIDRWLHHEQTYFSGTISRGCSSIIRVKIRVDKVKGASLLANRQGTATDLWQ